MFECPVFHPVLFPVRKLYFSPASCLQLYLDTSDTWSWYSSVVIEKPHMSCLVLLYLPLMKMRRSSCFVFYSILNTTSKAWIMFWEVQGSLPNTTSCHCVVNCRIMIMAAQTWATFIFQSWSFPSGIVNPYCNNKTLQFIRDAKKVVAGI